MRGKACTNLPVVRSFLLMRATGKLAKSVAGPLDGFCSKPSEDLQMKLASLIIVVAIGFIAPSSFSQSLTFAEVVATGAVPLTALQLKELVSGASWSTALHGSGPTI